MRRIGVVLVMAMIGQAGFAVQPVAVAELEQELAASRQSPDDELAGRLSPMELTERLPSADLARLIATLPGDKSREALRVLADMSEFLDPAAAQIPARPAPDESAQREMMGRVVEYVSRTTHKLPNFFATRRTTRFEDWPQGLGNVAEVAGRYIPPQVVGSEKALVTYRNGNEVVTAPARSTKRKTRMSLGLYTWGLFGPVLSTVLLDAARSTLAWGRWEQDGDTVLAVFHYSVPMQKSSYKVKFCCYPQGSVLVPIDRNAAYHGEIAFHPEDGTIVSLRLMADLDQGDLGTVMNEAVAGMPLSRADTLIEYGPVEIGGKIYICPRRSVAISRARVAERFRPERRSKGVFPITVEPQPQTVSRTHPVDDYELGPARTYINDLSFTDYHVFRSEARIIVDGSR